MADEAEAGSSASSAEPAARAELQRTLAAALARVPGASALLTLECLRAATAPSPALQHTVFYVTGFLTQDEAESAQSAARVAALHEALPLDPAALSLVRVAWASGSAGAALSAAHATAAAGGALGVARMVASLSPAYHLGMAVYSLVGGGGGGQPAAPSPWDDLDFRAKHRHAKDVGVALGGVLQQLAAGEPGAAAAAAAAPPPRRVLLGHSLGGRVVLHALAALAPPAGQRQQRPAVAAAAVFGAAQAGPEDRAEVWGAALRALPPAGGALFNVFNPRDPALSAMGTLGRVLQVDGWARHLPAGLRPVAAPPAQQEHQCQLVNVDASPYFEGEGGPGGAGSYVHSYRTAYMQLLRCERMAPLFAGAQ